MRIKTQTQDYRILILLFLEHLQGQSSKVARKKQRKTRSGGRTADLEVAGQCQEEDVYIHSKFQVLPALCWTIFLSKRWPPKKQSTSCLPPQMRTTKWWHASLPPPPPSPPPSPHYLAWQTVPPSQQRFNYACKVDGVIHPQKVVYYWDLKFIHLHPSSSIFSG